jgi:hypothetical protein
MTFVRAVQDAAFKNCCLKSGRYDGAKRNYFFPRMNHRGADCVSRSETSRSVYIASNIKA